MNTNKDNGISAEDLNRKANDEWNKLNKYEPGQIAGEKSNIPSLLDDKKQKQSMVEGIIADLANQRADIDATKQMIQLLTEQQNQMAQMINQQTQAINQLAGNSQAQPGNEGQQGLNMEALASLGDIAEKLVGAYKQLKGNDNPGEPPILSNEQIKQEMLSSYFDNLNTGKAINNFVKDALKKKVTRTVVNDTLKELGSHEPQ